jgi:hypothetical protein
MGIKARLDRLERLVKPSATIDGFLMTLDDADTQAAHNADMKQSGYRLAKDTGLFRFWTKGNEQHKNTN